MALLLHTPWHHVRDPSRDLLQEIVLDEADEYWRSEPGDAGLHFSDDDGCRSRLVLVYKEGRGFRVTYHRTGMASEQELRFQEGDDSSVEMNIGGESIFSPARAFVPKEMAWKLVLEFLAHGERPGSPIGTWWEDNGML